MPYLAGFGIALPARIVTNDELAPQLAVTPDWIVAQSGILTRRYAADTDTVVSLATTAAFDCLTNTGVSPEELGMILVASGSADTFCPGPASAIAAALGLTATPALDLTLPSAGSLTGLVLAARLAETTGPILVIGTEIMSRRVDRTPEGKNTAILFGDGAGAALISPTSGFAKIQDTCLHTDGNSASALAILDTPAGKRLHMDGGLIIRHALRRIPEAMEELLHRQKMPASAIGAFLLHQANANFFSRIARSLQVPENLFFANIQRYGNTSSASLLIAAHEWREANPSPLERPIMFSAFGAGLNWGALLALPA
jgi:3-oxoacyl-[acyl-carrier-protein] synthase-3